jgi:hypothetical protein
VLSNHLLSNQPPYPPLSRFGLTGSDPAVRLVLPVLTLTLTTGVVAGSDTAVGLPLPDAGPNSNPNPNPNPNHRYRGRVGYCGWAFSSWC